MTNYALLDVARDRLHFWQGRLQTAFREGNQQDAAACERMIDEYALLVIALTYLESYAKVDRTRRPPRALAG